jgi:hypothetical protein
MAVLSGTDRAPAVPRMLDSSLTRRQEANLRRKSRGMLAGTSRIKRRRIKRKIKIRKMIKSKIRSKRRKRPGIRSYS